MTKQQGPDTSAVNLSDRDLLRHSFYSQDPLQEPNLTLHLPDGVQMNAILSAYDHRTFKLPCARCGAARHYKGFVVELTNGQRTLLGNHCGALEFGDLWEQYSRIFRKSRDRQGLLKRCETLRPILPRLVELAVVWQGRLVLTKQAFRGFRDDFPKLCERLLDVAQKQDGRLVAEVETSKSGGDETSTVLETRHFGTLQGIEAFSVGKLTRRLEDARYSLVSANEVLKRDNLDDGSLENVVKNTGDAIDVLERVALAHNAVITFFSPDNLDQICSWIRGFPELETEYLNENGQLERVVVREKTIVDIQESVIYSLTRRAEKKDRRKFEQTLRMAKAAGKAGELVASSPKHFREQFRKRQGVRKISETVRLCPPKISQIEQITVSALHTILGN